MQRSLIWLFLAFCFVTSLGSLATEAKAGALAAGGLATALPHQSPVVPVKVWRDCQRIARCSGCTPVFRCRSCTYQRQCPRRRGPCEWADVCVWGPYLPLAPRGVPIRQ